MASLPTDDPRILETIERALEPFKHRLSPEALALVRQEVASHVVTQPYPLALLRKLRQAPIVQESGVQLIEPNEAGESGVRPTEANEAGANGASSATAGQARRRGA